MLFCQLSGAATTASVFWAWFVAILSRVDAVSSGVHPWPSAAVTKAAKAASKATSQLTSLSGLLSGKIGASTVWDMLRKRLASERFPSPVKLSAAAFFAYRLARCLPSGRNLLGSLCLPLLARFRANHAPGGQRLAGEGQIRFSHTTTGGSLEVDYLEQEPAAFA